MQTCQGCKGDKFLIPFSMAFQPIVNVVERTVFAHEALVRGLQEQGAGTVLSAVDHANRYAFDQQCRVKAIELASKLSLGETASKLSINFMPNAVYEPNACIKLTLAAAKRTGLPTDRILFEFTESERLDTAHVRAIVQAYREMGFLTAIDDFGAGYAGLALLGEFQPDLIKLDMDLIRGIDTDRARQKIVKHLVRMIHDLGIMMICEGVETVQEYNALADLGVTYMQGYLFARPSFESLAQPVWPDEGKISSAA